MDSESIKSGSLKRSDPDPIFSLQRTFRDPVHLLGHDQWGRFGHTVAPAGDLNGDGFADLLVGAPFDGEDGHGAVYVFHGSAEGIREKHAQRILARDLHSGMRAFGWALAGGKDVDGNGYPGNQLIRAGILISEWGK